MTKLVGLWAISALLLSTSISAADVTLDFSAGLPTGAVINNGAIEYQGYRISSGGTSPVGVASIGRFYGNGIPTLSTVPLSIQRIDGTSFSLNGLNVFIAGTLTGGLANFDITPFDANGVEGTPVQFAAAGTALLTSIVKTGTLANGDLTYSESYAGGTVPGPSGPFGTVSRIKIGAGIEFVTALTLGSAASSGTASAPAPISVPIPGSYSLLLMVGLGIVTRKAAG